MDNIINIIESQFGLKCVGIEPIFGGLSAINYKVKTDSFTYFLKVYNKKKAQASLWIDNINYYIPALVWLNNNTKLHNRIVQPLTTVKGNYRFDDNNNVFLLFDYIDGVTVGKVMTNDQIMEAAEIIACLHSTGDENPVYPEVIKEDFCIPFCLSLEQFIMENLNSASNDIKEILQPCSNNLLSKNKELKLLSDKIKMKNNETVLCHTDAHGFNLMQSENLFLVDWEGLKLAPAEADLVMFTKKDYWAIFIKQYMKLRPHFEIDNDLLLFYILRRKIEDIWAFIEGLLFDNLSEEQRKRDLTYLLECCNSLDSLCFEL